MMTLLVIGAIYFALSTLATVAFARHMNLSDARAYLTRREAASITGDRMMWRSSDVARRERSRLKPAQG